MSQFNEIMKYGFDFDFDINENDYVIEISNDFAGGFIGKRGKNIKAMRKKINCEIEITNGDVRYLKINDWSKNWAAVGQIIYKRNETK